MAYETLRAVGLTVAAFVTAGILCAAIRPAGVQPDLRLAENPRSDDRPNIVLVMVDDMGFSDLGSYGGEIATPHLDRLAEEGLRFTQFYNTSKCFPTRASLMTGLYAHQVGMGERIDTLRNGVTIAEVLREAGYRTYMTGKWHGLENPFDRGFDRYYGLVDGAVNHFNPGEQRPGEPPPARKTPGHVRTWAIDGQVFRPYTPDDPDFYSTDAYTEKALDYLNQHGSEHADKPFFLYIAYQAPHDPLQARPEDIEKYQGKYMDGWDVLRRRRHEQQVEMGLIDPKWTLPEYGTILERWQRTSTFTTRYWDDSLRILPWEVVEGKADWDLKMAVYAAMVDRVDQQMGRLLDKIHEMGEEENTLVMFLSDNGGSAEVVHNQQNRDHPPVDPPGSMAAWHSVDAPWAFLSNTPFRHYKNWSHEGGIATPFIAWWPERIGAGGITREIAHLIDVMATAVDAAGAEYPKVWRNERIHPLEGKSLLPVFEQGVREGHDALFFEWNGGKAVRSGRWKLVDARGADTHWELYDMEADRTETRDLAAAHPDRVDTLAAMWEAWAERVGATH